MLTFDESGQKYRIAFQHNPRKRRTMAMLFSLKEPGQPAELLAQAKARASKADTYSKAAGRLVVLDKLILERFDRAARKNIWARYWSLTNRTC